MKYFDKTFWKMSLGFIAIILASLSILAGLKVYENNQSQVQNVSLQAH